MALSVSATVGALLTTLDTSLDTAMGTGLSGGITLAPGAYSNITDGALKTLVRNGWRLALGALLDVLEAEGLLVEGGGGGGGGLGGSIAQNQVAVGDASGDISGSAHLTYNGTQLGVTGSIRATTYLELPKVAAPGVPSTNNGRMYQKADGKLYFKNDGGTEYDLTGGGGGGLAGGGTADQIAYWTDPTTLAGSPDITRSASVITLNAANADIDTHIRGQARANLVNIDAALGRVGINRAAGTHGATLDIDNLAVAESPLNVRDNGTSVFEILDGGNMTSSGDFTTLRAVDGKLLRRLHNPSNGASATAELQIGWQFSPTTKFLYMGYTGASFNVGLPAILPEETGYLGYFGDKHLLIHSTDPTAAAVNGKIILACGDYAAGAKRIEIDRGITISPFANSSGAPKDFVFLGPAHTNVPASSETIDVDWKLNRTVHHQTGAIATLRSFLVRAPAHSFAASSTITTAATFVVEGPPTQGANATITNPVALWVQAGLSQLDGNVTVAGAANNEALNVGGRLSLLETTTASATASYGKVYVRSSDAQPYFMPSGGTEHKIEQVLYGYKLADQTKTSDATPALDGDMKVTAAASSKYQLDAMVRVNLESDNPGVELLLAGTATVTNFAGELSTHFAPNAGSPTESFAIDATSTDINGAGTFGNYVIRIRGTIEISTGGTVGISWAQSTSHADDTTVKKGSYIKLSRI